MIPKNPSGFLPSVFPGSGSARRAVAGAVALVDRGWLETGPVIAHRTASVSADPRPQPHQEGNDVTGRYHGHFSTPVRRRASVPRADP